MCAHVPQNEDLAALAAQQYYVECGKNISQERLAKMLPSVIPDSCLAGSSTTGKWADMVIAAFRKVRGCLLLLFILCLLLLSSSFVVVVCCHLLWVFVVVYYLGAV